VRENAVYWDSALGRSGAPQLVESEEVPWHVIRSIAKGTAYVPHKKS